MRALFQRIIPALCSVPSGFNTLLPMAARIGILIGGENQRLHPSGFHFGIVMQEDQQFAARDAAGKVAGSSQSEVDFRALPRDADKLFCELAGLNFSRIVQYDNCLEGNGGRRIARKGDVDRRTGAPSLRPTV